MYMIVESCDILHGLDASTSSAQDLFSPVGVKPKLDCLSSFGLASEDCVSTSTFGASAAFFFPGKSKSFGADGAPLFTGVDVAGRSGKSAEVGTDCVFSLC